MPPCGGHRLPFHIGVADMAVSSRAPVWGASVSTSASILHWWMFQVVPPCGGHPPTVLGRKSPIRCFKSCPRVGGIQKPSHKRRQPPGFKSCPRVGGIALISSVPSRLAVFQVVPPCGGHQLVAAVFTFISSFKSCPRVGGILDLLSQDLRTRVSSRAPVWGASQARSTHH